MSLTEQYTIALQQPDMVEDSAQKQAIVLLEQLSLELLNRTAMPISQLLGKLWPFASDNEDSINGLYLWGGVGRGKTWLMNLFFEQLATDRKYRIHFHHFMLDIHDQLSALDRQKNPLRVIAKRLAKKYQVLCIDEFIVTNITDAMILNELLQHLFHHRVNLVATSNRVPDDLYLNGLQRERFLPAIALINERMHVFHLDGGIDHRTSLLESADVYYCPHDEDSEQQIQQRMQELSVTTIEEDKVLCVLKRNLRTIRCSEEIAWFDFATICSAPRAAQDYIELARRFSTIIISDIPVMNEYSDDMSRRFIYLIDELYDRNVKLIASAAAEPQQLYRGNMLKFAFQRTSSRLIEMRSHQYLSQAHRPF